MACHIFLESSQWRLQLFFRPHLNQRFAQEVMALQNVGSPNFGNFETPKFGTKWHLEVASMANHREYYKVKGGALPQVQVMMSLVNPCMLAVWPCTKSAPTNALTNLLFGLCMYGWIIESLIIHPSPHLGVAAHPSTLEMLRIRECTLTPSSSIVSFLDSHLSLLRNVGVCQHCTTWHTTLI